VAQAGEEIAGIAVIAGIADIGKAKAHRGLTLMTLIGKNRDIATSGNRKSKAYRGGAETRRKSGHQGIGESESKSLPRINADRRGSGKDRDIGKAKPDHGLTLMTLIGRTKNLPRMIADRGGDRVIL
jgi:hypothetical protein